MAENVGVKVTGHRSQVTGVNGNVTGNNLVNNKAEMVNRILQ